VEVSTKQCTPRLADFEGSAEEDFVDVVKNELKFLTIFIHNRHFMARIFLFVRCFMSP